MPDDTGEVLGKIDHAVLLLARAMLIVRANRFMRDFCCAKMLDDETAVERRSLARAVRSLMDRLFGFLFLWDVGHIAVLVRHGAPFAELPPAFRQLQDQMLRRPGGDREMVDILALILQHDEEAVLTAVDCALAEGVPVKTHFLNLLHCLIDGKTSGTRDIDTPQALTLSREPMANVARYDGLRLANDGGRHAS